jgi:Winged helix DNA-binding domain
MSSLSWEQVRRRRLARSHLLARAPRERLVDVVRDVCGVQAQVTSAAELAIGARVDGVTQADVRAELWQQRSLVKTWTVRGTLHLHPADDLPMWAAATRAVGPPWHEAYGLDASQGAAVLDAIADALDGRCLLRAELADEVAQRVGEWARERIASGWGYIIGSAAAFGKVCHGPPRGAKVTFVRTDQWSGWREVDPDEGLAEARRRYLATYGPTGPHEFAEWFGIKGPEARRLLEPLEDAGLAGEPPHATGPLRLLPEYDCYVMGFREREQLVPEPVRELLEKHPRGRFEGIAGVPTLLVDGVVAGLWRRSKLGKRIAILVEPVRRLNAEERRLLETEVERIGAFFDTEPKLQVGSLSA